MPRLTRAALRSLAPLLRARRFLVWLGLLAVLGGVLCAIPLFDVLGFEAAFALSLPVSLAAADLGAWVVRRARAAPAATDPLPPEPLRAVAHAVGRAAALALSTLVLPLAILALDGLRVRNCDPLFGLACFAALPALSAALMAAVGVVLGLVAGPRRALSNALPYLAVVALVVGVGLRFYFQPPVFFYDVLVGYFPGNLYDEDIALGAPLAWSRLYQIGWVAALVVLAAAHLDRERLALRLRPRPGGRRRLFAAGVALALAAGALGRTGGARGFDVTEADVAAFLGGRFESENFVIYYPVGTEIADQIELIAEDHEFRLAQLRATLALPPIDYKITSYYFAKAEDKARYMGAKNVYMAKPWRREIYVHHVPFPHPVLRHELAHVVAGEFGEPLFKVSARGPLGLPLLFNVGMIEGIAVAADWPDKFDRPLTPHESVKAMRLLGLEPPIQQLLSTGFFQFAAARSYTVSGSFLRFLYETRGAAPLKAAYRSGGDLAAAYGVPLRALVAEWSSMIDAIRLSPDAEQAVRERFRKKSIFARPCPHAVAKARREAAHAAGRDDLDGALAAMRAACAMSPGEPSFRLDLAKLLVEDDQRDAARAELAALAGDAERSSSIRAEASIELAKLDAQAGDLAAAARALDAVAGLALDDDLGRGVAARRVALGHQGLAGDALRRYFFGVEPPGGEDDGTRIGRAAAAALAEPDLALAHYLYGRALEHHAPPAEVAAPLARALELGLPDPRLERECAIMLAETSYVGDDDGSLERAIAILTRADQPTVTRLYGEDFRARLAWKRQRAATRAATSR
jgi:hypothetical protein